MWSDTMIIGNNYITLLIRAEKGDVLSLTGWQGWKDGTKLANVPNSIPRFSSFVEACAAIEREQKEEKR